MISVAEAEAAIQAYAPRLVAKFHSLSALAGLVLQEPIKMERDQPPFDRIAMDGIALDHSTTLAGRREFKIAGVQAAGAAPLRLESVEHCIEAMTGAQLPAGCDLVVPVEKITVRDGVAHLNPDTELTPWLNVHRRGSDCRADAKVLQPGLRLGGVEVAVIASAGHAGAISSPLPRIMVISTGNELVEPGQPIAAWQIRRSNSHGLRAALTRHGFNQVGDDHLPDDPAILRERLGVHLDGHDVLILSGGVSMGRFDYVPQVLNELGVAQVFHKIAQRPGKPLWFGARADGKAVYALPGNPVSTLVCLRRFVIPGLHAAMNAQTITPETIALAADCKAHAELAVFLPIRLADDSQGRRWAEPRPTRGSGDFLSLLGSDGFVELPPRRGMMNRGDVVSFYPW